MKRYAIKVEKGREFLQSKKDVIYLGDKSLDIHNKVIDILNTKNPLNNLNENVIYILENEKDVCFEVEYYYTHKVLYKKNSVVLQRVSF